MEKHFENIQLHYSTKDIDGYKPIFKEAFTMKFIGKEIENAKWITLYFGVGENKEDFVFCFESQKLRPTKKLLELSEILNGISTFTHPRYSKFIKMFPGFIKGDNENLFDYRTLFDNAPGSIVVNKEFEIPLTSYFINFFAESYLFDTTLDSDKKHWKQIDLREILLSLEPKKS